MSAAILERSCACTFASSSKFPQREYEFKNFNTIKNFWPKPSQKKNLLKFWGDCKYDIMVMCTYNVGVDNKLTTWCKSAHHIL